VKRFQPVDVCPGVRHPLLPTTKEQEKAGKTGLFFIPCTYPSGDTTLLDYFFITGNNSIALSPKLL